MRMLSMASSIGATSFISAASATVCSRAVRKKAAFLIRNRRSVGPEIEYPPDRKRNAPSVCSARAILVEWCIPIKLA